jgi:hypothetical protein
MPKLTKTLLTKLIAEEYARLTEGDNLDPAKINATGKLNVELGNLLKALNAFKSKVLQDESMAPVKDTSMPVLIKRLEKEISAISTSPGNYVKMQDEIPKGKPAVKSVAVKPQVKVV